MHCMQKGNSNVIRNCEICIQFLNTFLHVANNLQTHLDAILKTSVAQAAASNKAEKKRMLFTEHYE